MYKPFLFMPLAAVFQGSTVPPATAQEKVTDHKVRIEIMTTENGETKRVTREFDASNEEELQDALRELGVMDHLSFDGGDGGMEIDIRRYGTYPGHAGAEAFEAPMPPQLPMPPDRPRGYLGISTTDAAPAQGTDGEGSPDGDGALVTEVVKGSPAATLGLMVGDVVVEVDGRKVEGPGTLTEVVRAHEPGSKVKVTWTRSGKKMNGTVELGEAPARAFAFAYPDHGSEAWDLETFHGDGAAGLRPRAFLGVTPGEGKSSGATIGGVEEGTAAAGMGIQAGDVITKVNATEILDFEDLSETVRRMQPGDTVAVTLVRNGSEMVLNGTLGTRAPDRMITLDPAREFRFEGLAPGDREELRREMDALRREMDELRRDLGMDLRVETRIRIQAMPLSQEEKRLLEQKGVHTLEKELQLGDLQVYPNPGNGAYRIRFDVADRGDLFVNVHDAAGEKVYEERITGFKGRYERTLDLTDKAVGTYFLVIEQNGRSSAQKLVKQ